MIFWLGFVLSDPALLQNQLNSAFGCCEVKKCHDPVEFRFTTVFGFLFSHYETLCICVCLSLSVTSKNKLQRIARLYPDCTKRITISFLSPLSLQIHTRIKQNSCPLCIFPDIIKTHTYTIPQDNNHKLAFLLPKQNPQIFCDTTIPPAPSQALIPPAPLTPSSFPTNASTGS